MVQSPSLARVLWDCLIGLKNLRVSSLGFKKDTNNKVQLLDHMKKVLQKSTRQALQIRTWEFQGAAG
jgi:hypothetical protein